MRYLTLLVFVSGAAAAGCGNPTGLAAYTPNVVDSLVSLYALSGTPVTTPSGFSIPSNAAVRTDLALSFDFAFDIDTAGRALLLQTGALKLGQQSGLQIGSQPFDSIKIAPTTGYQLDSAVVVHDSSVVIAHSSTSTCVTVLGVAYPYYAKLLVLTIDTTSGPNGRRIDLRILTDRNCGYRGLEAGLPTH
jgi:hypothetical protein